MTRWNFKLNHGMYYVYHLRSEYNPDRYYVGLATDLKRRLVEYNAGESIHTNKFKPWCLIGYSAFLSKSRAEAFEACLKTPSGRAFAKKRL